MYLLLVVLVARDAGIENVDAGFTIRMKKRYTQDVKLKPNLRKCMQEKNLNHLEYLQQISHSCFAVWCIVQVFQSSIHWHGYFLHLIIGYSSTLLQNSLKNLQVLTRSLLFIQFHTWRLESSFMWSPRSFSYQIPKLCLIRKIGIMNSSTIHTQTHHKWHVNIQHVLIWQSMMAQ